MHRIVVVASLFLAVVVGVLTVAPRMVAWDRHRDGLIRWVAAATEQAVTVDGPIDLHLLPRPTLSLTEITFVSPPGAAMATALEVERVDLRLAALPLLQGRLEVQELRLVRPELSLDAPVGVPGLAGLAGLGTLLPLAGEGPRRLSVIDGSASMGGTGAVSTTFDAINFELLESAPGGPLEAAGWLNAAHQRLEFDARLGRIDERDGGSVQLELIAAPLDAPPVTLTFGGLVWWNQALPRIRGEVVAAGDDLRVGVALVDQLLPHPLPVAAAAAAEMPFEIRGRLELEGRQVRAEDLQLRLAETEAHGDLTVDVAMPPRIDLALEVPRVALEDRRWNAALGALPAALAGGSMTGRIELVVGEVAYRGDRIRRLRAALVLAEPGRVAVEGLRALLPGQTAASFDGSLAEGESGVVLDGALTLATDDLGRTLAWLGMEPGVAPGRLRTFGLATALSIDRHRLRLDDLDLRLDASHITGSIGAQWSDRAQIAAALTVDRLNLDAYGAPSGLWSAVSAALGRVDLALETEIERLIWRGLRFEAVHLGGRSVDARFALEQLAFRSTESAGTISGVVDLRAADFDLGIRAVTDHPSSLLRRLGIEGAPPALTRLAPVTLEGHARGRVEAFDLDLSLSNREAALRVAGEAGWSEEGSSYRLELSAFHPDHRAFLGELGMPLPAAEAGGLGPIDVQGTVRRTPEHETTVAGTARLGPMSLTGRTAWQGADERPRIEIQLSAGDVRADLLEAILAVAGWRRGMGSLAELGPGSWPGTALDLWRLDRFDATVDLSAKGGLAGAGLEIEARAENGRLTLQRLAAKPFHGQLELEAVLDVRRPLPFVAVDLTLHAIEPQELAAWLGLEPVVEGRGELHLEVTSAGQSVADLIRGMIGTLELSVDDGRLLGLDLGVDGQRPSPPAPEAPSTPPSPPAALPSPLPSLPFSHLGGEFALHRGILRAEDVTLRLDDADGRIEGLVDLLSWAGDLELSWRTADGREVALALVGPLVRPQVVWRDPGATVEDAAPAPATMP